MRAIAVAALCAVPAWSFAQSPSRPPLDIDDVVTLVGLTQFSDDQRVTTIQRRCISFEVTDAALSRLRQAGASAALVSAVRSACNNRPDATAETPSDPPGTALRRLGATDVSIDLYGKITRETDRYMRFVNISDEDPTFRFIHAAIWMTVPRRASTVSTDVTCVWTMPDGRTLPPAAITVEVGGPTTRNGWLTSVHSADDFGGKWPVGKYRIACTSGGEPLAEIPFEVIDR